MTLAVARNPYASNVPDSLITAAGRLGIPVRTVDLPSLRTGIAPLGALTVTDEAGPVAATSLAPFLLFGFPAAVVALRLLTRTARAQNPVDSVLLADDKAAAAARLAQAGVAQVRTEICPFDRCQVTAVAAEIGYPVVVKRAHGAQGRWVRRAADPAALATALAELAAEGPGALIVQPEVVECAGISVRAVLTGGQLIAVTERRAAPPEWRSNIAGGATQRRIELTGEEQDLVHGAAAALGLGHAGVDLLRTGAGPRVLEVNACPDFTSMQPHYPADLAEAVLRASW
ncbi:MAG TPA: ATP-grasp domain-containing protein [Streptosporangiaceae bacterium]|jgi:ribosomal protein S6--L-glutamate ligase